MNTEKVKRLPFWLRIRKMCFVSKKHDGPFICLRDMFGRKYYLCLTCFYIMLDEERKLNEYMIEEEKKKIKPVMKLGIS
jgi:hypothetical protein